MRLISNELKSIVDNQGISGTSVNVNIHGGTVNQGYAGQINNINGGTRDLLLTYFKKRAFSLIYTVIIVILLIQSTVFTDMGLNIGQLILNWFSKLLAL